MNNHTVSVDITRPSRNKISIGRRVVLAKGIGWTSNQIKNVDQQLFLENIPKDGTNLQTLQHNPSPAQIRDSGFRKKENKTGLRNQKKKAQEKTNAPIFKTPNSRWYTIGRDLHEIIPLLLSIIGNQRTKTPWPKIPKSENAGNHKQTIKSWPYNFLGQAK